MVFYCGDCKKESPTRVCDECRSQRAKCANTRCTNNVPLSGKFKFCKYCACITEGCRNQKQENFKICAECLKKWVRKVCYICQKKDADPPYGSCTSCDKARKDCIRCDKKQ